MSSSTCRNCRATTSVEQIWKIHLNTSGELKNGIEKNGPEVAVDKFSKDAWAVYEMLAPFDYE